jgi:hypothetical protein
MFVSIFIIGSLRNGKKIEYFKDFSTAFNVLEKKFNLNYI